MNREITVIRKTDAAATALAQTTQTENNQVTPAIENMRETERDAEKIKRKISYFERRAADALRSGNFAEVYDLDAEIQRLKLLRCGIIMKAAFCSGKKF